MIVLPWPSSRLSPNARLYWAAKNKARAQARLDGANAAYAVAGGIRGLRARFAGTDPIPMTITFYPPDHRHRDDDNMVGSFKSYRDGIADALGVNDRRFRPRYVFADPEKPGRVEVSFSRVDSPSTGCYNEAAPESVCALDPGPDHLAKDLPHGEKA